MAKLLRIFRGVDFKDVGNQATQVDYAQIFSCLQDMAKNNNDLQSVYQSLKKNIMYTKEKLQYSEDLIEMIEEKVESVDELLERFHRTFCAEEEALQQKKEKLKKMREDVADSKLRLLSMRKPEMQKYVKLARDKTVPSIVGFVRKEREELEHRLISANADVNDYIERNMDDQQACSGIQRYRETLQKDHTDYMLQILNEYGHLKGKRTLLLRTPLFNGNDGKSDLLELFQVSKEEMEATRKECISLREMKETLTARIEEQKQTKAALTESISELHAKLLNERDMDVLLPSTSSQISGPQDVGLNVISSL
ncbi:unconventional myosin-XVIIIa-like [Ostrea edulis]|uniref:unconventional myosin-XVIIIa-like n=1 Tax=Ostrea edulis TaxID=37623 RepID=UPI0024AF4404|nr:unconventional myosin-XVIIIa-like [Ostrea edulis]